MSTIHVRWKYLLPAAGAIVIVLVVYFSSTQNEQLLSTIGYLNASYTAPLSEPDTFVADFENTISKPTDFVGDTSWVDPMDDPPARKGKPEAVEKPAPANANGKPGMDGKTAGNAPEDAKGASSNVADYIGAAGAVPQKPLPQLEAPKNAKPLDFRIYSHNIRNGVHEQLAAGETPWADRKKMVVSSLRMHAAANTVFLLQEALRFQLDDVMDKLNFGSPGEAPEWAAVGGGRVDGKLQGEAVPIIYRPAEWELVHEHTFWLNPIDAGAPHAGWDAKYPRIATVAILRHRATGNYINVANTHLDHKGHEARKQSARLLRTYMDEINGWPSFIAGDMNSTPTDWAYKEIVWTFVDPHKYVSAYNRYGHPEYTVTGFSGKALQETKRIDYIFAPKYLSRLSQDPCAKQSPLFLRLRGYGLLHSKYGGVYMSDHRPVMADFTFGSCGNKAQAQ